MRKLSLVALVTLLIAAAPASSLAQPELKTEEQKTLYALGLVIAQNLSSFALSPADLEIVKAASPTASPARKRRSISRRTAEDPGAAEDARQRGGRTGAQVGPGLRRQGGRREGRGQDALGRHRHHAQARHGPVPPRRTR